LKSTRHSKYCNSIQAPATPSSPGKIAYLANKHPPDPAEPHRFPNNTHRTPSYTSPKLGGLKRHRRLRRTLTTGDSSTKRRAALAGSVSFPSVSETGPGCVAAWRGLGIGCFCIGLEETSPESEPLAYATALVLNCRRGCEPTDRVSPGRGDVVVTADDRKRPPPERVEDEFCAELDLTRPDTCPLLLASSERRLKRLERAHRRAPLGSLRRLLHLRG